MSKKICCYNVGEGDQWGGNKYGKWNKRSTNKYNPNEVKFKQHNPLVSTTF